MPIVVTDIQPTPNPNAAKFMLSQAVSESPTSFFDEDAAKDDPIASRLFAIPGVTSLLLLGDFITVNKSPDVEWDDIMPAVERVLATV